MALSLQAPPKPLQILPSQRRRAVRLILGTAAIALGTLAYWVHFQARASLLEDLKSSAFLEVKSSVREVDNWLGRRKAEVATIANTPTAKRLNWPTLQPYLQTEVERLQDFHLLALLDKDGNFYTNQGKSGDASDREFFQQAMQGQLFVSDPIVSRSTGVRQVSIAAPIRPQSATSSPQGAIAGPIPIDRLTQAIEQLQYGPDSYAFVLNASGQTIVQPQARQTEAVNLLASPEPGWSYLARQMVARKAGIDSFQLDGQPRYVAYFPLEQTDWSLALVIPRRNIESALRPLDGLALAIVSLAIAMLLILWRVQVWERRHLQQAKEAADTAAAELGAALHQLRHTQAQLVQSEKMSSLGQLVAGIAHEFNNPVNFIHANLVHARTYFDQISELLRLYQAELEPPPPAIAAQLEAMDWEFVQDDLPQLLTSMRAGSERIRQLVASLRTFARLDEEGIKRVNLQDNLASALVLLSERLRSQPFRGEVTVTWRETTLPPIDCYPGLLNQVFLHLLTNALDAIDRAARQDRTAPAATAPAIAIRPKILNRDWIQIGIADNGGGVPAAMRACLFDPFTTTKPVGQGTGLGLALSYQAVVAQHGGRLRYRSALGRGTEFAIVLPRRAV